MRNLLHYPLAFLTLCLLLAACSSGGPTLGPSATTTSAVLTSTPPPTATVGQPQTASLRGNTALVASGSAPNFTTSPPPNGTVFPLSDTVLQLTPITSPTGDSVTDYTHSLSGGTALTFQGTQIVNGVTRYVFEFKEPGLSVDVSTTGTTKLPDGGQLNLSTNTLNYTLLAFWNLQPASMSGNAYWGFGLSGYQTPASGVPASGTATYVGNASGFAFIPSGSSHSNAGLAGQASISVNFPAATVAGSLTNMTASNEGDIPGPTPWNDVALSGTLSGATLQGSTAVTNSPSDPQGLTLSTAAKGTFAGALFGPHGEEIGIGWNLYDPTGNGKAAVGTLGATKQ